MPGLRHRSRGWRGAWLAKDIYDELERESRRMSSALRLRDWLAEKADSPIRRAIYEKMGVDAMIKRGGRDPA
jgi:hypothetical protein